MLDFLYGQGVDPNRVRLFSYGVTEPAVQGEAEDAWEESRRVNLRVVSR